MKKIKIYNLKGEVVGEQDLNPSLFEVEVKPVVVQQVVVAQQANARHPWAHAKQRSEVRGGGKKPWKQKGTGRARHGSTRSPLWRGGGVTFGPESNRNFTKKINKKMKQSALRMVLSDKLAEGRLVLIDSLSLPEPKTKSMADILTKLPLKGRTTLFITGKDARNLILSGRNLQDVDFLGADSLNVYDLLKAHSLVIPVNLLEKIEELYSGKAKKESAGSAGNK